MIINANKNLEQSNMSNNWEMIGKDISKLQELIGQLEKIVEQEEKKEADINKKESKIDKSQTNIISNINEE